MELYIHQQTTSREDAAAQKNDNIVGGDHPETIDADIIRNETRLPPKTCAFCSAKTRARAKNRDDVPIGADATRSSRPQAVARTTRTQCANPRNDADSQTHEMDWRAEPGNSPCYDAHKLGLRD